MVISTAVVSSNEVCYGTNSKVRPLQVVKCVTHWAKHYRVSRVRMSL